MTPKKRDYFDKQVQWVLDRLPKKVIRLLDEMPLHVEDYPSARLKRELGIEHDEDLCGCFSGISKEHIHNADARIPNMIMIYREGIYSMAEDEAGKPNRTELRRQIKITILHELAHFFGFDEDQLEELGYA